MAEEKTAAAKSAGSSDDNLIAALCYIIGLVSLFVLFTEKKSNKMLAFHAWQSLILMVIVLVVWVVLGMGTVFISVITSGLGSLLGCLFIPLGLAVFIGFLFLAYKAYQGEKVLVPIIGEFAQKQVK